jgi:predicted AAA+ superfamily ATPase
MFERTLEKELKKAAKSGKASIILGPRQVGKTTLIEKLLSKKEYLFVNGDDPASRASFTNPSTERLRSIIGDHNILFVDEAQRIENIGITLKLITDQFKHIQLYVSGSSALEINSQTSEALTGRKREFIMFPISWEEYESKIGYLEAEQQIENRLLYGLYPEIINNPGGERDALSNLTDSYLFRDVLDISQVKKPEVLRKLVQLLALQIGSEVSYNELANSLQVDKNTVSRYIDLLEAGYVIFKLSSFSRNVRNEIKKNQKIYFYDNGIRNMLIGNFNPLEIRNDKGALWENFLMSERLKQNKYKKTYAEMYFWRTRQQQEVDLVEEKAGKITGFEFKWSPRKKVKLPTTFTDAYNADQQVVTRDNFREFVVV